MDSKIKLPKLLNINQVAKILGVMPPTLRRWDKNGKLKAIRVGNKKRSWRKKISSRGYYQNYEYGIVCFAHSTPLIPTFSKSTVIFID